MTDLSSAGYELSQNSTDNSKEYFFVKLTDSAYRAIEEYEKSNANNKRATIQILENVGRLSFPSSANVDKQFSFSIDKVEGLLECLQQEQNKLDVFGALKYKIKIHASNDVFEKTRYRMVAAEESQKNKCTQEIKPNKNDIGRKVKLENKYIKQPNIALKRDQILTTTTNQSPKSFSNFSSNPTILSNIPPKSKISTAIQSPSAANVNTLSSIIHGLDDSSAIFSSSQSISAKPTQLLPASSSLFSLSSVNSAHNAITGGDNNLNTNNLKTVKSKSSTPKINQKISSVSKKLPSSSFSSSIGSGSSGIVSGGIDVGSSCNSNKCNKGGLKTINMAIGNSNKIQQGESIEITNSKNNRNQKNVNCALPDITKKKIRDRVIHLLALKPYKKPELYSKLMNEGIRDREKSSVNGILKDISTIHHNTYNLKNHIWNEVNEEWPFYSEQEIQMLKQRKPQNQTTSLSSDGCGSSSSDQSQMPNGSPQPTVTGPSLDLDRFYEEPTAKKRRISLFRKDTNENNRSNLIPKKHDHKLEDNAITISYGVLRNDETRSLPQIEDTINGQNIRPRQRDIISSHQHNSSTVMSKQIVNSNYNNHSQTHKSSSELFNNAGDERRQSSSKSSQSMTNSNITNAATKTRSTPPDISNEMEGKTMTLIDYRTSNTGCHHQNSSTSRDISNGKEGSPTTNIPPYSFRKFTPITSIAQRRLYKNEFESDYSEYVDLLKKIETVGRKFYMLAELLKNQMDNIEISNDIRRQIFLEYEKVNQDEKHQQEKARFEYLHAKLAHIKYLVSEFDKTLSDGTASTSIN